MLYGNIRLRQKNHGLKTINTAVVLAVCTFNDGARSLTEILKEMDILPGRFMRPFCEQKDISRIQNAQRQIQGAPKEARQAKRQRRLADDEAQALPGWSPFACSPS